MPLSVSQMHTYIYTIEISYTKCINLINKCLLSMCLVPDTMLSTGSAKGSKVESLLLWSFKGRAVDSYPKKMGGY